MKRVLAVGRATKTDTGKVVITTMTEETPWYADHNNLATLAEYMEEQGDTVKDIIYMLEKPWKFDEEFKTANKKYEGA